MKGMSVNEWEHTMIGGEGGREEGFNSLAKSSQRFVSS